MMECVLFERYTIRKAAYETKNNSQSENYITKQKEKCETGIKRERIEKKKTVPIINKENKEEN